MQRSGPPEEPRFQPHYDANATSRVCEGDLASALSHITLLEHFVESGLSSMIVFEDEAELDPDFETKYLTFRKRLPSDFDIVQFWHHEDKAHHLRYQSQYKISGNDYVMRSYAPWGTVGYVVSRKGALKLLSKVKPIWNSYDAMFIDLIKANDFVTYMPTDDLVTCTNTS